MMFSYFFYKKIGFYVTGVWLFPGVLEGLGSSGKLVETISTDPGTYLCPESRVMTKNSRGQLFRPGTVCPSKRFKGIDGEHCNFLF